MIDLPMAARLIVYTFLVEHFKGQDGESLRGADVKDLLDDYFGPLLPRPKMDDLAVMALAASLTAAAYVRLGASQGIGDDQGERL